MRDIDASQPFLLAGATAAESNTSIGARRTRRSAKKRKFYEMDYLTVSTPSGWKVTNDAAVSPGGGGISRRPEGRRGFREFSAMPILRFDTRLGRAVKDMEPIGQFWLVSDRAKAVLEQVDAGAFAFIECRVELRDGAEGPRYWLCDVVRVLDALNEPESTAMIKKNDRGDKVYNMIGDEILVFKEDVVSSNHIFRMRYRESTVICDDVMRDACKTAGLKGWSFRDTTRSSL